MRPRALALFAPDGAPDRRTPSRFRLLTASCHPARAIALLWMILAVAAVGWSSAPQRAAAQTPSWVPDGLGVVVDTATSARTATVAAGQVRDLYVIADTDPTPPNPLSLRVRAYQFGIELDPRLQLLGVTYPPEVVFPNSPAPMDYILGLGDCIPLGGGPVVLLTLHVQLPAGQGGATDLRVDVRPLTDGREMLFNTCSGEGDLRRFTPAGGVLLNPSSPTIVRFVGSPPVLVQGRSLTLAWNTYGATSVALGGGAVAASGFLSLQPISDSTYELSATNGALSAQAQVGVQVIQRPRIAHFTAEPFELGGQTLAALNWDVLGTDSVLLDGDQSLTPLSGVLVALKSPPVWVLTAENEWGVSAATAGFDIGQLPPIIASFTVSPNTFVPGQVVTLQWVVVGASTVTIDPDVGTVDPSTGSIDLAPAVTTTYTLTATNANGSSTATQLAQLLPPGIGRFDASPDHIFPGQSTTLSWEVASFETLRIDPDVGELNQATGSVQATPSAPNTLYTLTVGNPEGTATAEALVTWMAPEATLAASQTTPYATIPIVLTATVQGADTAEIEPTVGPIPPSGGQFEVLVETPTTFVLTASNAAGTTTRQITITPKKPDVVFTASSTAPFPDQSITLTVTALGASSVTLEPGFGSIGPSGGTVTTTVATQTTFVAAATNAAGTTTKQITVSPKSPLVLSFAGDPQELIPNQTGTLIWTVTHADAVSIEPGGFTGLPLSGSVPIDPPSTTTYTLTATNSAGATTATTTVSRTPFSILSFTATPDNILPGGTSTLAWEVIGSATVSIDGLGPQPMVGQLVVQPDITSVYVLRAQNGDITATRSVTVHVGGPTSGVLAASWAGDSYPGETPALAPYTPFDFWVVALDPVGGIEAWECSVHLPPGMVVAGGRTLNPGSTDFGAGDDNWIVGTGGNCLSGTVVPLVKYSMCLFLGPIPEGTSLYVAGATPSSFPNGLPGYLVCNSPGDLRNLEPGPPLPLSDSGGPTPAMALQLSASRVSGNVVVHWQLSQDRLPHSIELRRRSDTELSRTVKVLSGSAATSAGQWVDDGVAPSARYTYSAIAEFDGLAIASGEVVVEPSGATPVITRSQLLPNVPNPFNPQTVLRFALQAPADVRLTIVDAAGHLVRSLTLPSLAAGPHSWTWTGEDDKGRAVGSGVYRVLMDASGQRSARSVTLIR